MARPGDAPSRRLTLLRIVAVVAFGVLVTRLWRIQLVQGGELRTQAEANRFVSREVDADRGVVYDAAGRQVVFNRPRYTVSVVPAALPAEPSARRRVLGALSRVLDVPVAVSSGAGRAARAAEAGAAAGLGEPPSLERLLPAEGVGVWEAVPVARNVPRDEAFDLMAASYDLPGVLIGEAPVREYPAGATLGPVLGFTGSIPEAELTAYRARGYRIYDIVGQSGLETTYEADLRGRKGEKVVEVDALGRELRKVGERPSVPGHSLHLTVDLTFQEAAEAALARGLAAIGARSGAVVAIDPRDGAVRALVSLPTYDNNLFSVGASPEAFAALLADPDRPLVSRAIAGQYAPGSTYKMITASAALEEGVVVPDTRVVCPGVITLANEYDPSVTYPFYCWLRSGHGAVTVQAAIAQSCDVYFYEVSGSYYERGADQDGLGSQRLARYARLFGLGEPTQIELIGEAGGRVPTSDWLSEALDMFWGTGETYFTGIGQGYTLATPLQMANVTAAVANGGTLYRPHLVDRVVDAEGGVVREPGGTLRQLPVAAEHLALVRQGMRDAVERGTAQRAWTHLPAEVSVAGKTGTAQFCDYVTFADGTKGCRRDREGDLLTHAWFVAFAPAEAPEIALAVFVDGSGLDREIEGSREAAPIAADVLRAYFGLPDVQPTATPCTACPTPTPCPGCPAPTQAPSAPVEAGNAP